MFFTIILGLNSFSNPNKKQLIRQNISLQPFVRKYSKPNSGVISGTPLADTLNNVFCHYTPSNPTNAIEVQSDKNFKVFPNPGRDVIWFTQPIKEFDVYSITGKLVMTQLSAVNRIDVSLLDEGVYLIKSEVGVVRFSVVR